MKQTKNSFKLFIKWKKKLTSYIHTIYAIYISKIKDNLLKNVGKYSKESIFIIKNLLYLKSSLHSKLRKNVKNCVYIGGY